MNLLDLYVAGGPPFMHPITLAFIIDLAVIAWLIFKFSKKEMVHPNKVEAVKQLGALALAFGIFGTLVGLFQAFDALEAMKETLPFNIIAGGLKVALINVLYGLIVFCLSMIVYLLMKMYGKQFIESR